MDYGFPMFGGLISIFLFIAGVMALFIPFWVYRIRNEVIEMNRQLSKLVKMHGYQGGYQMGEASKSDKLTLTSPSHTPFQYTLNL